MRTATPITPPTPDSLRFTPVSHPEPLQMVYYRNYIKLCVQMKIPQFKSVDEILGEEKPSCGIVSNTLLKQQITAADTNCLYHLD